MNTNQLKRFAQAARKKLLEQIGAKLEYVLTSDSAELREKAGQVRQLKTELELTSKAMLVEKVAYTWFNRLVALRFMDVNDYQPTGVRVISPKDGYTLPELLDETKQGNIPSELEVDKKRINDLLDGRIPSSNPQNEVYKMLLIASCNYLHKVFPFLYERINDYTELLLPDDLTSDFSVLQDVREGMSAEDASQVEIIGWLYQFYISEKKDEVFASKEKVKKEDIPAATQLFTPRWIVEYMVQNTLGKLWLQNRPNSKLRVHMPYFIESESLKAKEYLKISSPEEIKLLDEAAGSGHILVYGFELFTKIYEEEGYNQAEIPTLIIKNNLYGNEIDERAAQLAGLALMMKAREYDKRFFKRSLIPEPNILCFKDLRLQNNELQSFLNKIKLNVSNELWHDLVFMRQATNLGSLIDPHSSLSEINQSIDKIKNLTVSLNAFEEFEKDELERSLKQLLLLKGKFHCVVDNPPYMGSGAMNKELSDFVKTNYPDSKSDLMTCFMEAGLNSLMPNGLIGMINLPSWLFLSSFESLRADLIKTYQIDSLLHMGRGIFGVDWGSTSFIIGKSVPKYNGTYLKLHKRNFQHIYPNDIKSIFLKAKENHSVKINYDKYREGEDLASIDDLIDDNGLQVWYTVNQRDFEKIPSSPIGYWLSESLINSFINGENLDSKTLIRQGLASGNNDFFIRLWFEVGFRHFKTDSVNVSDAITSKSKWFPFNKGGEFRRWYGNNEYVIMFDQMGYELLSKSGNNLPSRNLYFRKALTWSAISSGNLSVRIQPDGFIFSNAGMVCIPDVKDFELILGLLNSKVSSKILSVLSPTLNFNAGDIKKIPVIIGSHSKSEIIDPVTDSISISKNEWDQVETSWEFKDSPFIQMKGQDLEESYDLYQQYWKNKFTQLHKNEEELNRQFIEVYGLKEELTPDVPLDEITILKEETSIENGQLVFNSEVVFSQFISYSVGCMFGRYSLDKEGLILANQGESLEDYQKRIETKKTEITFLPDDDNIIPVLDDEWFEDDIVGRFKEFLGVTFGENNIDKNLAFVESSIGTNIRKYFLKSFYKDHIQRYKKRPIYWMFSSPKENFSVLIYMHRYTPDTLNNILNKYLREFIEKLKTRKEHLQHIMVSGNATEQNKAIKQLDKIEEMILDCQEYEREILFPLAAERIDINLDDGVLVNYNKFGKTIKEVQGLNDKKTKKQVKEFDWIDASQIR